MATYEGVVEFQGKPLTLAGERAQPKKKAPNFRLTPDLGQITEFDDRRGDKVFILTSALSVDTSVCESQLQQFDERANELTDANIEIWYITRDLPFALQRHVDEQGIKNINVFSDYQFREYGDNYGLTIRDFDLLARATVVVDKKGNVAYKEIVSEATHEPDYDAAINAAKSASQNE